MDWYARYNPRINPKNEFNYVPPHVTKDWPPPNYVDPGTRVNIVRIVEGVPVALGIMAVALRLYSKVSSHRKFRLDDGAIVVALIFAIVRAASVLMCTRFGFGLHRWDIPYGNLPSLNKFIYLAIMCYSMGITFTRISITLRYLRLFPPEYKKIRLGCLILLSMFLTLFIVMFIVMGLSCRPLTAIWEPDTAGKCINYKALFICYISSNTVIDFALYFCPIPYMWTLNLPKRQRIALVLIFALGFCVCIVSIGEIIGTFLTFHQGYIDYTWAGPWLWFLTALEMDLAIICASLPDLKSLVVRVWPGLLVTPYQSTSGISKETPPPLPSPIRPRLRPDWMRSSLATSLRSVDDSLHTFFSHGRRGSDSRRGSDADGHDLERVNTQRLSRVVEQEEIVKTDNSVSY